MAKQITLNDVAAEAGVSYQTVSRVINGKGEIAEETRERVLAAIRNLGYRPNIIARSLARGSSRTIGVVTVELYRFAPSRIATGIQRRCQELGYSLLLNWFGGGEKCCRELDDLAGRQVDAIIWLGTEPAGDTSWADPQTLATLPPIVFCEMHPRPGLHTISVDNRRDAATVTRHLLDTGRRHVGIITGPLDRSIACDRLAGWQDALRETGLDPAPELRAEGDWSPASGESCFRDLMSRDRQIDAVLACNDRMALGVLHAARKAGRRVPEELAVAGIDNIPEAAFFSPPLTSVQQPLSDMGRTAADLAVELAEARRKGKSQLDRSSIILSSELVVRESTATR